MQVNLQADLPQTETDSGVGGGKDDIDQALTNLQASLEGSTIEAGHVSEEINHLGLINPPCVPLSLPLTKFHISPSNRTILLQLYMK